MNTGARFLLRSLPGLLIPLQLFIAASPALGCGGDCWPHGQNIIVQAGTVAGAIRTGCASDTILVEEGALVRSEATDAIGIDSDGGNDSVTNAGSILVAASDAQGGKDERCGVHWKHACCAADADATAIGIQAGSGQDTVRNTGGIEASASAQLTDSGTARSLAIGIDAGSGNDSSGNLASCGTLAVTASSTATLSGESWEILGWRGEQRSVDAGAQAIGLLGGSGQDTIRNDAGLTVSAVSDIRVAEASVTLGDARDADLSLHGSAQAAGIDGGSGKDQLVNQGELAVTAASTVETSSLTVSGVAGSSANPTADRCHPASRGTELDASSQATAAAVGIDAGGAPGSCFPGGQGKEAILNSGTLSAVARSEVSQSDVSIALLQAAGADSSLASSALAIGLNGGNGQDRLTNLGELTVTATSSVESQRLSLTGITASSNREAEFDSSLAAESRAVGIAAGRSCDEVLGIGNSSTISVQATSTADADSFALSLVDGLPFSRLDIVSDTSLTAEAEAAGILGGSGKDAIANEGTLSVSATADIDSLAVELNLADAASAKADLQAAAEAAGIDSGSGNDLIQNSGALAAAATAETSSWSATFSAVDVASGDFGTTTSAEAVGISSGQGRDAVDNTGSLAAAASSEALVADFSMSLFDLTPLTEDGGFSTTLKAAATGISSGCQEDLITSSGSVTATADTEATRIGVDIGAEGLPEMEDFGSPENLASADVSLSSKATGIDGGAGDDEITNQGNLVADASATYWGGSLSLSLPLVELPVPTPFPAFSMMDAGTRAEAQATGIQGGGGDELIRNEGSLDIDASASSLNVAASVGFQGSVDDFAIAATRVDAMTEVQAAASGIEGGEGDEQILNSGDLTVDAVAETLAVAANVAVQNKAEPKYLIDLQGTLADVHSTAAADASGILGGTGLHAITSSGEITVAAQSSNAGVGLSAAVTTEAEKGLVMDGAVVKADSTAGAEAVGIDGGEGEDEIRSSGAVTVSAEAQALSAAIALTYQGSSSKALGVQGAGATVTTTAEASAEGLAGGAGDDLIVNEGALDVQADSLAIAASVAVDIMPGKSPGLGIALANAQNQATAQATGIAGGSGNDLLTNSGAVTVDADATAVAASVSVTRQGAAGSGTLDPASFDSGNSAEAVAKGIDGGEGDEIIVNSGALNVGSTAVAPSLGVAVTTSKGISAAITTAEASASSTGIDTGEGTHQVHNTGAISADSTAVAAAVSVSIAKEGAAIGIDTVWDGGTTATADAAGIRAQAGNDQLENEAAITADSTAVAPSVDVAITGKGLSVGISTATATATSVGIDSGAGDDQVLNSGAITSTAYANADAISVDISGKGVAGSGNDVWDGGVEASALAKGIDAGTGSNNVINSGSITADSTATTVSAGVSIVGKGLSASVSTATAAAESIGIDPGETAQALWNSGSITADATATAVTVNADIAGQGVAAALDEVWDGGTKATATARGLRMGAGDNNLWNQGTIVADAEATSPSVGVAIAGRGLAGAVTTSTASADAVGIDTAEGNDVVQNSGAITTTAEAEAYAISAAITGKGVGVAGDAVWDGGTTATARAAGIDAGAGNDSVVNAANIAADSSATTVGVGLSAAGEGITAAVSTSTAEALALGIEAGEGLDRIESVGNITAEASSTAVTANVAVTGKGIAGAADAVWDGGTHSTAVAKAIDAGSGIEEDTILSKGDITASSDATTVAVSAAITGQGLSLATTTATTTAQAVGIDAGAGNNTTHSQGDITVDASATGVSVAASIMGTGLSGAADAVWDGGTHTTALATGINAGEGDDSIDSLGNITATSNAVTVSADVAITGTGLSLATSTATTTAQAVGIDAGAGNDTIQSQGAITADSNATGVAVAASITGTGLSGAADAVWDGGTDTKATAVGIDAGEGDDVLDVGGTILAAADATTVAVDAAITGKGVSLAATASNTTATAVGIDGGAGNDLIDNTAGISASASSTGVGVAVGLTGLGLSGATDAVWDSGTTATTAATGIDGGDGDDTIVNTGNILLTSDADTVAVDVALTGAGVSAALTNTTAGAQAVGISGGEGADSISNEGAITGSADATAVGVGVSISGAGVSASATDVWENGISGQAAFTGIDAGSGNDALTNSGGITGTSTTTTPAVSVSVSGIGIGAAANTATADAQALGIDGGAGDDTITNTGAIRVTSTADVNTVIVSITGVGAAAGLDSIWDGGTTATATAAGITGGDGDDAIGNSAAIAASSTADTASTAVTMTLAGASASLANSTAKARASGIDGGEGQDEISNSGAISAAANAAADTVAVSVSGVGASFGGDQWSEDTLASSTAIGIDGGSGDDAILNTAAITATSVSDSDATAVTVSLVGYADSEAENISRALAAGIAGGEGNDTIENSGNITATGLATADAGSVTVNLAGAAPAEAGTTAMAVGIGLDGGAGDDTMRNSGSISIASGASTDASSVAVTLAGYGDSDADIRAEALAAGISGADGNDTISNTGSLTLTSTATAEAGSVSIGLAGAVLGEAGTTASAAAVGLDGGAGADVIQNSGAIAATVSASTDSSSTGVVLAGSGDSSAECSSLAVVTGIGGGEGDDSIVNSASGSISLTSLATAEAGGVQVGLAGAVGGEAGTTATAIATAIDGGLGSDTIRNAAQINVTASTSTAADSTTVGIFGSADADVNTDAVTVAQGIAGGEGSDTIENTGSLSVSSSAAMSLDAYSFDFGGSAGGQGTLTADSSSVGISGGSGSDNIENGGKISVSAFSTMKVEGGSDVAFGSASAGANTTAVTKAIGIDAGAGDDAVTSRNTIAVSALTAMTLDSSSFSFGGTAASGEGAMSASTRATGICGGEGSDLITSEAAITVSPKTAMSALAGSDVAFGSSAAGTSLTADTQAAGIDAGAGNDTIVNQGGITVGYYSSDGSDAMTKIDVSGSSWSFGGSGSVNSAALATGSSVGIEAGSGDDTIASEANIEVNSTSYARTNASSYTFAGSSGSSGVVTATSSAAGIRGGEGDDSIRNSAAMTVRARSWTDSTGSVETTFGSSKSYAGAVSSASAAGIEGGAGDEVIRNTGSISAAALAFAHGSTNSEVFAGSPSATSATTVTAFAAGIDAGTGNHSIDNEGQISAGATASTALEATADSKISSNRALSAAGMSATAVGISTEEGGDAITNSESGSILAAASVAATPYAHSDESSTATATGYAAAASGIDAGDGDNTVLNLGTIRAEAGATITATAVSRSITATAYSTAAATAEVQAAGISTGRADDVITNGSAGQVIARAVATVSAEGTPRPGENAHTDYGIAAVGSAASPLCSAALGISAGDGDNTIENLGLIDAQAQAKASARGESDTASTSNRSTANAAAAATASGISAGDGADEVLNEAGASISAKATTELDATADPDENGYINDPGAAAASAAQGIELGDGAKNVINRGGISALAESSLTASSRAESDMWDTNTRIVASVTSAAQGIKTGAGDSNILNSGEIVSWAAAASYADCSSDSVDDAWSQLDELLVAEAQGICAAGGGIVAVENSGGIVAEASASAAARGRGDSGGDGYGEVHMTLKPEVSAAGIQAGDAASTAIHNREGATIDVAATLSADLDLNGDEFAVAGREWDHGVQAEAQARGITAGDGQAEITNDGDIQVDLDSRVDVWTYSRSTTRSTHTYAWMTSNATAAGIEAGTGAHSIDNTGNLRVRATNAAYGNRGSPASDSYYNADAEVGAFANTIARGISAGGGDGQLTNSGSIEVNAGSAGYGYTRGDSGAGDGVAVTRVSLSASASGIWVGSGGNLVAVENTGGITAGAVSDCKNPDPFGGGPKEAYAHGDDSSYADARATSGAAGIELGDNGSMAVDNSGTITARASAYSHAADDEPTVISLAAASSQGIKVGNGASTIGNSGSIAASSTAVGTWYSDERTYWSGAAAEAAGIQAGGGNKQIVNDGSIEARAIAQVNHGAATAQAYGIHALAGNNTIINNGTIIASAEVSGGLPSWAVQAYGIRTGSGDDYVENNGTITTLVTAPGGTVKGIGIDTGAGNDQVVFGDGSYIGCTLELGEGNDGLTVIGSGSISGDVYAGLGIDRLTLDGATSFSLDQTYDFESLTKLGSNTVSLNGALTLEQLEVYDGILQIEDDYQFLDTGAFSAKVYGGGSCGQLLVAGNLGLAGTMTVVRGPGAYRDGASYEVLTAEGLSGSFASIVLPGSTPLLSFALADGGNNGYRVTASTQPFATVATTRNQRALTGCLDAILPTAAGDLSLVLGEIQAMAPAGYAEALASLSPDTYGCTARAACGAADLFTRALSERLRSLRPLAAESRDRAPRPLLRRTAMGTRSGPGAAEQRLADHGLWLSGFGQWGGLEAAYDFDLYGSTLGWDRELGRGLTAGVGLGYASTRLRYQDGRGAGLANAVTGSAYGSGAVGPLRVDASLSYGRQSYESSRSVEVGSLQRTATSEHGSDALAAHLGAGLALGRRPWTLEPLAGAQYVYLHEEGFTEEGAGGASLKVQERSLQALACDLGLRLGLFLDLGGRALAAELSAAWRHDFALDPGTITASFVEAPGQAFTVSGPEAGRNGVLLGASLLLRRSGRFAAAAKYGLELRDGYRANSFGGEVQF